MDLEETRAFLAVLDHGSFKAAADISKQPRATLRRRVEALEARAGVALLERSHSGVIATAAGQLLARQARAILRDTNALLDALRELGDEPSGDLRIGVPVELPPQGAAIVTGLLHARYPRLRLHVRTSADPVAELLEQVDIALQLGHGPAPTRCRTHALMHVREGLRASRTLVQRHGLPRSLDELRHVPLLGCTDAGAAMQWPLFDGGSIEVTPTLTSSSPQLLRRLAELGLGIALLSEADGRPFAEDDDTLVPVLDGIVGRTRELRVVVPEVLAETAKVRAVVGQLMNITAMPERTTHEPVPLLRAMM